MIVLISYLFYIWGAFDVSGALARANMDRATLLVLETYAHKHHVELSMKTGKVSVNLEGNRHAAFEEMPEWVTQDGSQTQVDIGQGYTTYLSQHAFGC